MSKLNESRVRYVLSNISYSDKTEYNMAQILREGYDIEISNSIVTLISNESKIKAVIAWEIVELKNYDNYKIDGVWSELLSDSNMIKDIKKSFTIDELEYEVTSAINSLTNMIELNEIDFFVVDVIDVIVPISSIVTTQNYALSLKEVHTEINLLSLDRMLYYLILSRYIDDELNNALNDMLSISDLLLISGSHMLVNVNHNSESVFEMSAVREGIKSYWVTNSNFNKNLRLKNDKPTIYDQYEILVNHNKDLGSVPIVIVDVNKINTSIDNPISCDYVGDITKAIAMKIDFTNNQYLDKEIKVEYNRFDDI